MLSFITGTGTRIWLYLGIAAAVVGAVLAVLKGQRAAGAAAERVKTMKETLDVKTAQQKAAARAPRDRAGVIDSLRDGTF